MSTIFTPSTNEQFAVISSDFQRKIGTISGSIIPSSIANSNFLASKPIRCDDVGNVFVKYPSEQLFEENIDFLIKLQDFTTINIVVSITPLASTKVTLKSAYITQAKIIQNNFFITDSLGNLVKNVDSYTFNTEFIDIQAVYSSSINLSAYFMFITFNDTRIKQISNSKIRIYQDEFNQWCAEKNTTTLIVKIYLQQVTTAGTGIFNSGTVIKFNLTKSSVAVLPGGNSLVTTPTPTATPSNLPKQFPPIYAFGIKSTNSGELAMGDTKDRVIPTINPNLSDLAVISVGPKHCAAITKDTMLLVWGDNTNNKASYKQTSPTLIVSPEKLENGFKDVVCTHTNTYALSRNGEVFGWGKTGNPPAPSGYYKTLVIGGGVKQLFAITDPGPPVSQTVFALKEDNTLWSFGQEGLTSLPQKVLSAYGGGDQSNDWKSIASGRGTHFLGIKQDGSLLGWGRNTFGQVGVSSNSHPLLPVFTENRDKDWRQVVVCNESSFGLKEDGTVWQWGKLHRFSSTTQTAPVKINTPLRFKKIIWGYQPSATYAWPFDPLNDICVLLLEVGGAVYVWTGFTTLTELPRNLFTQNSWPPFPIDDISAGYGVVFLTQEDSTKYKTTKVYSCGYNNNGQLGLGDWINRSKPTPNSFVKEWSAISCGRYTTILDDTKRLMVFGEVSLEPIFWPVLTTSPAYIYPTNKTDPLIYPKTGAAKILGFSTNQSTLAIDSNGTMEFFCYSKEAGSVQRLTGFVSQKFLLCSAGNTHYAALDWDRKLYTWGFNAKGQLGNLATAYIPCCIKLSDTDLWNYIFCGDECTFGIKTNGTLWSWGKNNVGQLGLGNTTNYSSPMQVGTDNNWFSVYSNDVGKVIAQKTDGTLWHWGFEFINDGGYSFERSPVQLGSDNTWVKVSLGHGSIYGIKQDKSLWSWGFNSQGELGLGDVEFRSTPTQIIPGTEWEDVEAGTGFVFFKGTSLIGITPGVSPTSSRTPTPTPTYNTTVTPTNSITPTISLSSTNTPTPTPTPTHTRPNLNIVIPVTPSVSRRPKAQPLSSKIKTRITLISPDGIVSPMIDTQKNSYTLVHNIINELTDPTTELEPSGGEAFCRYVLTPVELNSDMMATRLLISFAASIPNECFIRVFYRTLNTVEDTETDIKNKHWRIVGTSGAIKTTPNEFRDFEFEITEIDYDDDAAIKEFNVFSIKIVLESSNDAKVPFVKDFRTIALL